MPAMRTALVLAGLLAMAVSSMVRAQEPETLPLPKQKLPAPAPLPSYYIPYPPPVVVPAMPPPMYSREGWAYFAPNYYGQMRPRIIQAPYGYYYLYNGQPYYGVSVGNGFLLRKTAGND